MSASIPGLVALQYRQGTINLAQNAATYDLLTASADLMILKIVLFCTVAGTGFTTVAVQTDNTTADVILAALAAAQVTAGKLLTTTWTQVTPLWLPAGKKLQFTLVGNGSAGTVLATVQYAVGGFS